MGVGGREGRYDVTISFTGNVTRAGIFSSPFPYLHPDTLVLL